MAPILKKFKVAMVAACPFPYPRGTPVRIFRMAEALGQNGCDVHLITYSLRAKMTDENGIPFNIHRIRRVPTYNRYAAGPSYQKLLVLDFLLLFKLLKILRTYDIDVIHAHHYEGLIISLLARRLTGHPVVYDAHTLLASELPYYNMGLNKCVKRQLGLFLDNLLPRQADFVLSVSEDIKQKLIKEGKISEKKIAVVANGIESCLFKTVVCQKNPSVKILVYAGNLAPFQGVEPLLRCFHQVRTHRKDVILHIVTDSSFAPYAPLADNLGIRPHIEIFSSNFKDLPKHLGVADILINPRSRCDGLSQKLLNYMAAGKAIVSFEGSAKTLKHQESGYVVSGENYSELAEAIMYLLNEDELRHKIGPNAKKIALEKYTWEKSAAQAMEIYANMKKVC